MSTLCPGSVTNISSLSMPCSCSDVGVWPIDEACCRAGITFCEDSFTHHGTVVVGPASYDGIEISYECLLGSRSEFSYLLCDFRHMFFDGFLTGLDDGFVSEGFSIGVFSRVGFSDWKLPNGEPDKVKPDISLMGFECMADFCFARFQFQSHVLEP